MRFLVFASRNCKEIVRDPLNLAFGFGFPIVLLLMLTAIQANIPVSLFMIEELAPGMAVFGLASISLFCGMLIAKDRSTSFLMRLFTSPLSASDFILGYTSPMLPIAVMQCAICFAVSIFLGLAMNVNVLVAIAVLIPAVVLFIGIGLMAGTVLTDRQVGVMVGAGLTNACAWLSGIWFAPGLVGGWFESVAYVLPFVYAVNTARAAIVGDYAAIFPQLWWVIGYAVVIMTTAIFIFRKKMDNDDM